MSKIALVCSLLLTIGTWCQHASAEEYALEKAEKYRLSGQYQLALEEAERLLAGPARDNGSVHYFYAFMLYRLKGDHAKVKHHLQEGLRMDPYSWDTDDARRLLVKLEKEERERLEVASIAGAKVGLTVDGAEVKSVEANSSAAKAGIIPGDKIVFIDNVSTSFMSTRSVASRLAGPAGSRVAVTVNRNGTKFSRFLHRTTTSTASTVTRSSSVNAKAQASSATSPTKPAAQSPSSESSSFPIEIFRRTKTTEDCEKRTRQALAYLPISVLETLRHSGVTILIVPDMITADPQLANQKPEYQNFGYDNCSGLFRPRDKRIVIPERFSIGNAPLQENPYTLWAALHEIGHAFDYVGHYANSEGFTKAFEDDSKYINNEIRVKYRYFLELKSGGPVELFAEIFSAVVAPNEDLRAVALSRSFPRCTKFIKDSVGLR